MIAEIIPEAYDAIGRPVARPFDHRHGYHPAFPIGRYVSQPLGIQCTSIGDVRRFLAGCKYVSDGEQFGKRDYWQPPEEFEKRKKGDCEDFALWTWRQLLSLGYDARFVIGSGSRYGDGHAWVEYFEQGKCFLVESLASRVATIPRLSIARYSPKLSVSWDGKTLTYFQHRKLDSSLSVRRVVCLLPEYLIFWAWYWVANSYRLPQAAWRLLRRNFLRRELWLQRKPWRH